MTNQINYGILGAGHLGNYHAQQLQNISGVALVGVYDINPAHAKRLSQKNNIKAYPSAKSLISDCDAISITTPASNHYDSGLLALQNNCNIFVEKPFTKNIQEAQQLIKLRNTKKLKIQVGHIERFNAAFLAFTKTLPDPMFIESHRLCSFNKRGLDVDVVLDLMIHDIDLSLFLIKSKIKKISAYGSAILTDSIDMANARLEFNGGKTVNLTASRISLKQMRQMRVFQKNSYSVIDFQEPSLNTWLVNKKGGLRSKNTAVVPNNALFVELKAFINSIQKDQPETMGAEEALETLKIASKIQEKIGKYK